MCSQLNNILKDLKHCYIYIIIYLSKLWLISGDVMKSLLPNTSPHYTKYLKFNNKFTMCSQQNNILKVLNNLLYRHNSIPLQTFG